MADNDYSVDSHAPKRKGFLGKKFLGISMLVWIAAVVVTGICIYAWRSRNVSDADPADGAEVVDGTADAPAAPEGMGTLYPLTPTGTVYGQSPKAVEDDAGPDTNEAWMRRAFSALVAKGNNPGEVQLALQAYLSGAHLSYAQSVMRDNALKACGMPPDSFEAGTSDGKPKPTPTSPVPKPTVPVPVKPKPVIPPKKPTPVVKPHPVPKPKPSKTHKVKKGDTLWDIAAHYYHNPMKWRDIAAKNHIRNPKRLQIGTILVLP